MAWNTPQRCASKEQGSWRSYPPILTRPWLRAAARVRVPGTSGLAYMQAENAPVARARAQAECFQGL